MVKLRWVINEKNQLQSSFFLETQANEKEANILGLKIRRIILDLIKYLE